MTANRDSASDVQARAVVAAHQAARRDPEWLSKPRTAIEIQARALALGLPAEDEDDEG